MHVDVHEPGRHSQPPGLYNPLILLAPLVLADLLNLPALDHQIQHIVNSSLGVNHSSVLYQNHLASSFRYW